MSTEILNEEVYKPKQLRLRGIPKDVYDILIERQATQKKKCSCQFSLEQTVYKLIRNAAKKEDE